MARTHIVGTSKEQVLEVLRDAYRRPVCFGDFVEQYAARFEGVRYGAGGKGCSELNTLVNVQQMDCVTFVENLLAMAQTARGAHEKYARGDTLLLTDAWLFRSFVQNLNHIRYYEGANCGWETRIHYFSDALRQMERIGWVEDIGALLGERYTKSIGYLSLNKRSFPGINDWDALARIERELTQAERFFVPLSEIYRYEQFAQTGDIVSLTTDIEGLDVSHVGIIQVENGNLYMTHASSKEWKVMLKVDFCAYMARRTTITGIVVHRPTL